MNSFSKSGSYQVALSRKKQPIEVDHGSMVKVFHRYTYMKDDNRTKKVSYVVKHPNLEQYKTLVLVEYKGRQHCQNHLKCYIIRSKKKWQRSPKCLIQSGVHVMS